MNDQLDENSYQARNKLLEDGLDQEKKSKSRWKRICLYGVVPIMILSAAGGAYINGAKIDTTKITKPVSGMFKQYLGEKSPIRTSINDIFEILKPEAPISIRLNINGQTHQYELDNNRVFDHTTQISYSDKLFYQQVIKPGFEKAGDNYKSVFNNYDTFKNVINWLATRPNNVGINVKLEGILQDGKKNFGVEGGKN